MKKYEFTGETLDWYNRILHRIRALKDFDNVKAGDIGGWIEKEENLAHEGDCWVYGEAKVYDGAEVSGSAKVYGEAEVCDEAEVYGSAKVYGEAEAYGEAEVYGSAEVYDWAKVYGEAEVYGLAEVSGSAIIEETKDYMTAGPIGSRDDVTTAFRTLNGVRIKCGCFYGNIEEFEEKIKGTHGDNKHAKEYLALAELLKIRFGE